METNTTQLHNCPQKGFLTYLKPNGKNATREGYFYIDGEIVVNARYKQQIGKSFCLVGAVQKFTAKVGK